MTSAVVLRTHFWDAHVSALYQQLRSDLSPSRVFAVLDVTSGGVDLAAVPPHAAHADAPNFAEKPGTTVLAITEEDCVRMNPLHVVGKRGEVGSKYRAESHVVAAFRALRTLFDRGTFDGLYLLEYDVKCHGSFAVPLGACDAIGADFMAKGSDGGHEPLHGGKDRWCWWGDLYGEELSRLPTEARRGCFFPLTRYSKRFLEALEADLGRSSGFCEVYLPTLCVHRGLTYAAMPPEIFGAFRFFRPMAPESFAALDADDRLYHPVKPTVSAWTFAEA